MSKNVYRDWYNRTTYNEFQRAMDGREKAKELARKNAEGGEPNVIGNAALLWAEGTDVARKIIRR